MSAIVYTAKRNIITTALKVSAADVGVAAVDDSFNSTTTDLSGLNADEWIYTSGFTGAANNGWCQVVVDSTANKITTYSALVDEIAGNNIKIDGYMHGLNQLYGIDFELRALVPSTADKKSVVNSQGGSRESILYREDNFLNLITHYIDEVSLNYWQEFFSSVKNNETFTFDRTGTSGTPVNPTNCELEGNYTLSRVGNIAKFTDAFKVYTGAV